MIAASRFNTITGDDWGRMFAEPVVNDLTRALYARRRMGLELMQAELESYQLEVVLVPCRVETNIGGCVRCVANRNCDWYRRFCAAHSSSRFRRKSAFDTCIKRKDTQRLLVRLIEGAPSRSKYAPELVGIAMHLAEREQQRREKAS